MRALSLATVLSVSVLIGGGFDALAEPAGVAQPRVDVYGDPLPEHALARLGTARLSPSDDTWAIALSPDGKIVASGVIPGAEHSRVELWDTATGKRTGVLVDATDNILAIAWSPDGRQLAIVHDYRAEIWDAAAQKLLGKMEWPATKNKWEGVLALCWSRDGRWIAGCLSGSHQVVVWEAATRRIAKSASLPQEPHAVAFSADGQQLAVGGKRLLQLRDVGSFDVRLDKKDLRDKVCSIAFSPDGHTLAGGVVVPISPGEKQSCVHACVRSWNAADGQQQQASDWIECSYLDIAYAADGRRLVVGAPGESVFLFDAVTLKKLKQVANGCGQHISVSADGKLLAASYLHLAIYDTLTGERLSPWESHWGCAWSARFSADGATIVSAGSDGVRFWDRKSGRLLRRLPGDEDHVCRCAFSHDGKLVVLSKTNGSGANVRTLASGELQRTIGPTRAATFGGAFIWSMDFSPDDRLLATGWITGNVLVWDMRRNDSRAAKGFQLPNAVMRVKFSPDGKMLGCGVFSGDTHLFEVENGRDMGPLAESAAGSLPAFDFSPAGSLLAIPGIDAPSSPKQGNGKERPWLMRVRLWDFQAKKQTWTSGQMPRPVSIAISPQGNLIAAGGDHGDCAIWVWSVETGKLLMKLQGSQEIATELTFSSDGRQLLSTFQDGNVIVWDVTTAR